MKNITTQQSSSCSLAFLKTLCNRQPRGWSISQNFDLIVSLQFGSHILNEYSNRVKLLLRVLFLIQCMH